MVETGLGSQTFFNLHLCANNIFKIPSDILCTNMSLVLDAGDQGMTEATSVLLVYSGELKMFPGQCYINIDGNVLITVSMWKL